jgi:hypothetical protein
LVDGGTPPVDFGDGTLIKPKPDSVMEGFVAELDTSCKLLWARSLPYNAWKAAFDSAGNIWIVNGDPARLTKFDPTGNVVVQKSFSGGGVYIHGLTVDAADNVIFSGSYSYAPSLGGNPLPEAQYGAFAAKLDKTGAHLWSKGFSGTKSCSRAIDDVAIDPSSGNVVASGSFGGSPNGCDLSLGGAPLPPTTPYPYYSSFVGRLSATDGSPLWSRGWSGTTARGACMTSSGATFMAGWATAAVDFGSGLIDPPDGGRTPYVARLLPDGGAHWGRRVSASATGTTYALQAICEGSLGESTLAVGHVDGWPLVPFIQLTAPDGDAGWTGKPSSFGDGRAAAASNRDIVYGGNVGYPNDSDIYIVRYTR